MPAAKPVPHLEAVADAPEALPLLHARAPVAGDAHAGSRSPTYTRVLVTILIVMRVVMRTGFVANRGCRMPL